MEILLQGVFRIWFCIPALGLAGKYLCSGQFNSIGNQLTVDSYTWQRRWRRLAAQSASWYATPSGAMGSRFTEILAAEWRGVLNRSWNSERPLVFAHVVLTKMLGIRRAQEIRARITRRERGCPRGQGRLQRQGGGQCRGAELSRDCALGEAPPGRYRLQTRSEELV